MFHPPAPHAPGVVLPSVSACGVGGSMGPCGRVPWPGLLKEQAALLLGGRECLHLIP